LAKAVKIKGAWLAPVWRLPFVLAKYQSGRKSALNKNVPDNWMHAAIECGLIQMIRHDHGEEPICGYLEQIDKSFVIPTITDAEIAAKVQIGLAKAAARIDPDKPLGPRKRHRAKPRRQRYRPGWKAPGMRK
jgi:hypothetical protein